MPYVAEPPRQSGSRYYFALLVLCALRLIQEVFQVVYILQKHPDISPYSEYAWQTATVFALAFATAVVMYRRDNPFAVLISGVADIYLVVLKLKAWLPMRDASGANVALSNWLLIPAASLVLAALAVRERRRATAAPGGAG